MPTAFTVMDCAILARTTGLAVQSLRELRDALLKAEPESIYYHFWGGLLRPTFDDPEFINDFAVWAWRELRDRALAERLAMVDPAAHATIEELREELLEVIESHLDGLERPLWVDRDGQFDFLAARVTVIPTRDTIVTPEDLPGGLRRFSRGSLFYHFIDARRRHDESLDDLRAWLGGFDRTRYAPLSARLAGVDPFQGSLSRLRDQVLDAVNRGLAEVPE
ncbi:MAG: DUF5752 family protein [Candidatus Krumholzibacteriia bacterium]